MNIKRILALVFVALLMLSFVSCNKCERHVDADDDLKCDNCGENFDDGAEAPENPMTTVRFTVRLDTGDTLAGIKLTLTRSDNKTYELTTGADGSVSASVELGAYYYSCVNLPDNCILETPGVKIQADTGSVEIIVMNNTPDGTERKPFFISDTENQIILAPGQEIFYTCHSSSEKYVRVGDANVTITYDGVTYSSTESVSLKVVSGGHAEFSLKNNSNSEISTILYLEAPLGSPENPILLSENSLTVDASSKIVIYYVWTAYKNGTLVIERPIDGVEISLTKTVEGDVPVKAATDDTGVASMEVSTGDIIKIEVSVKSVNVGEPNDVKISLIIDE